MRDESAFQALLHELTRISVQGLASLPAGPGKGLQRGGRSAPGTVGRAGPSLTPPPAPPGPAATLYIGLEYESQAGQRLLLQPHHLAPGNTEGTSGRPIPMQPRSGRPVQGASAAPLLSQDLPLFLHAQDDIGIRKTPPRLTAGPGACKDIGSSPQVPQDVARLLQRVGQEDEQRSGKTAMAADEGSRISGGAEGLMLQRIYIVTPDCSARFASRPCLQFQVREFDHPHRILLVLRCCAQTRTSYRARGSEMKQALLDLK